MQYAWISGSISWDGDVATRPRNGGPIFASSWNGGNFSASWERNSMDSQSWILRTARSRKRAV